MPVISARFNSDSRTAFSIGKYKNAFLRPNECNSVIPTKRPSRNQLVWIIIASVIIFIFFTPVIVAAQFQQSHFIITPTCVQQPCRLAQPGNSSTGYIDIDRRVNVTVYESIGFKYLCIGLQISIPLGVGSVGCGPISHSQLGADVTIYPESCSIAGTSPSADFSSKTDNPRCFLKLSNSGSAGTWATACNVGGLSGALLTADGASALEQIQIPSGGVAYL